MDKGIIFVKTNKGNDEIKNEAGQLIYGEAKRILVLIDDKSTVKELRKRVPPSLRDELDSLLQELITGGFIQDQKKLESVPESPSPKISTPLKISVPKGTSTNNHLTAPTQISGESNELGLDFTGSATGQMLAAEVANAKAQAEAEVWAQYESQQDDTPIPTPVKQVDVNAEREALKLRLAEQQKIETEAARFKAEQEIARVKAEQEAALARAKVEAERQARAAEKARLEAEAARQLAEREAARIKAEHEAALVRARAEAEATARAEAAAKAEAEARIEVEKQARAAEKAKLLAEQAAAAARAEEQARLQAEADKLLKLQQEEARIAAELKAARAQAKVEEEARIRADEKARQSRAAANSPAAESPNQNPIPIQAEAQPDSQTQKLAEAQAKVWSEAEQRAKAQASRYVETPPAGAWQAEARPAASAPTQVRRAPQKPLPVGKIVLALIVLVVGAIFLLPLVWPMQDYIAQAEQKLSVHLKQPVHIGGMRASLIPSKMELKNVTIGEQQELQAGSIVLNFDLATLFTGIKEIPRVEISDVEISAESFNKALPWFVAAGRDGLHPVQRITLHSVRIKDFVLPMVSGGLDFSPQGELIKAVLNSEDKKIQVQLQPQQSGWKFDLSLKGGSLPLLSDIVFDELNASGLADASGVNVNQIEGFLYGGKLTGNTRVTWNKGWQMLGQVSVQNMELQAVFPKFGLEGKLDGEASLNLLGKNLTSLTQSPQITGKFLVKKGAINTVDLVEAARPGGNIVVGGRTHFDEVSGTLQVANNGYQLRQIQMAGGQMSANGSLDVAADKKLSGKLNVNLQMREEMGGVAMVVAGTAMEPTLQYGR